MVSFRKPELTFRRLLFVKELRMNVRNGNEIFRSEDEIEQEIDQWSDQVHFKSMVRYWTHVTCNLPTNGIIKDSAKAAAGYVRMGGV